MIRPVNKHDYMLDRDLRPRERLSPATSAIRFARQLLEQFERDLERAGDQLTEEQLQTICNAADMAWKAAENAAFLGHSGFHAHPLEAVNWEV